MKPLFRQIPGVARIVSGRHVIDQHARYKEQNAVTSQSDIYSGFFLEWWHPDALSFQRYGQSLDYQLRASSSAALVTGNFVIDWIQPKQSMMVIWGFISMRWNAVELPIHDGMSAICRWGLDCLQNPMLPVAIIFINERLLWLMQL